MEFSREQVKAAYALNLCTVSVSQIIDYDDVNIMEQEYEAILNNLNLEQMPKDEALLKILKQILDVITFFRIQEGDKRFIEKEYQQRMKNAIWSAVPNIGLLVAGGNPVTMAVSLASQVGIGYMNYRRCKAEGEFEKEKEMWQLERTAMEQFNGLRRELFDTAWRLAANYEFPDELRLTERQIKQYDDILMDNDLIRKYERLNAIKDAFIAYPPFWYHFGNTANAIAGSRFPLSDETRADYRTKAKEHFEQYRESNQNGLLREDPVSSGCALELIDLLDTEKDSEYIQELLEEALRYSGRQNDVMQLAAMTYLRLNQQEKAAELLNYLVNEQYNTTLNAQLLSSILVKQFVLDHSNEARNRYEILTTRIGEQYLYPMPETKGIASVDLEEQFLNMQRSVLRKQYTNALDSLIDRYTIRYGKIIPLTNTERQYKDYEYLNVGRMVAMRKKHIAQSLQESDKGGEFCYRLKNKGIQYCIIDLLNDLFEDVCDFDFVDDDVQRALIDSVTEALKKKNANLATIQDSLNAGVFDRSRMEYLLDITLESFVGGFVEELYETIDAYVLNLEELQDFAIAGDNLALFCQNKQLPQPVDTYEDGITLPVAVETNPNRPFDLNSFGEEAVRSNWGFQNAHKMMELLRSELPRVASDTGEFDYYLRGDLKADRYCNGVRKLRMDPHLKAKVLAILDDTDSHGGYDLLFTEFGIIPVKNNSAKAPVAYDDVQWTVDRRKLEIDGAFGSSELNLNALYELIQTLKTYAEQPWNKKSESNNLLNKLPFGKKD